MKNFKRLEDGKLEIYSHKAIKSFVVIEYEGWDYLLDFETNLVYDIGSVLASLVRNLSPYDDIETQLEEVLKKYDVVNLEPVEGYDAFAVKEEYRREYK